MIINKASSDILAQRLVNLEGSNSGGTHARGSLSSVNGKIKSNNIEPEQSGSFDAGTIYVSYKTSGSGGSGGESIWEKTSAGINTISNVGIGTDLSGSNTHLLHLFNGTGCGTIGAGIGMISCRIEQRCNNSIIITKW